MDKQKLLNLLETDAKLTLEDGECQKTPYSRNGHDGEAEQYTESVERKVAAWLEEHNYPTKIAAGNKSYTVKYGKGG